MQSTTMIAAFTLLAFIHGAPLDAQHAKTSKCDRVSSTTFDFGRTGGSIRPSAMRLGSDGALSQVDSTKATPTSRTIPRDAVRGLARLAWSASFTGLPVAPRKPTRNPDAARDFIEIKSACGAKHVEYASGEGAPAFRELLSLLTLLSR